MKPPSSLSRPDRRVPELDGIRAMAILLVVIWHYVHLVTESAPGTLWGRVNILLRLTWSGVDLFFVLSGFLIGGILLAQRESSNYYSAFYGRRTLRIFPLYFGFIAVCVILEQLEANFLPPSLGWLFEPALPLLSLATFTQNFAMVVARNMGNSALGGTWSLAVEEQFYILLPILIRLIPVRRLPALLFLLVGCGILFRMGLYLATPAKAGQAAYLLLPCRWDPLFLGVLLAWILRHPLWSARVASAGGLLRTVTIMLGLGCVASAITAQGVIMAPSMTLWGYSLIGLFYALFVLVVVAGHAPWFSAALRSRPLVHLGTISYGVYIFHSPVNGVLHSLIFGAQPRFVTPAQMGVTALAFVATLLLAEASWLWFEKPFVDSSHRWFRYRRPESSQNDHQA